MPRRRDIDHFLLHFRLERDDDTASVQMKRRSSLIVTAFEAASPNGQTPLNFLIARMLLIFGGEKPDADVIRGVAIETKQLNQDNRPTELLGVLEVI